MKPTRPSFTAAFVATCRGLAPLLPESAQLALDPYGLRVLGERAEQWMSALMAAPAPVRALAWGPMLPMLPWTLYMQVRTRVLDDALRAFLASGGRQVVILGAGFDARGWRMREALGDAIVYEVDHPATAALKRERFGAHPGVRPLSWNFESTPMSSLPDALASLGHRRDQRTFTLWEGVTMYLTREAFGATLDAVRAYSAARSALAFNYVDRALIDRASIATSAVRAVVRAVGEPFRLGFSPDELRATLSEHGFRVESDRGFEERARELLGERWARVVRRGRRIALVERTTTVIAR
ncbi:MAG: SAM-dependent methyltransferase [Polyangiales bacterium]